MDKPMMLYGSYDLLRREGAARPNTGWVGYSQKKPPDNVEAFKWYLKSAEQGYRQAMGPVIHGYREGVGVEKDDQEADRWLEKDGPLASSFQQLEMNFDQYLQWYSQELQSTFDQAASGNDAAQVTIARSYQGLGRFSRFRPGGSGRARVGTGVAYRLAGSCALVLEGGREGEY
jgi:hypothetical protein